MAAKNDRKYLTPVFVVEILKHHSDKNNHVTPAFILVELDKEPYGIKIQRQALYRIMNTLRGEFTHVFGNAEVGYWYDKRGYSLDF